MSTQKWTDMDKYRNEFIMDRNRENSRRGRPAMPASPLGSYIQELMEERNWTQLDLEARTGVKRSTLSRIMNGQEPKPGQLVKIAKALGIPASRLLLVLGHDIDPVPNLEPDLRRIAETIRAMPELTEIFDMLAGLSPEDRDFFRDSLRALHHRRLHRRSPPLPTEPPEGL